MARFSGGSCGVGLQIAVRSEEPYRIHCYSILRSLAASDVTSGHDPLGRRLYLLLMPAANDYDFLARPHRELC